MPLPVRVTIAKLISSGDGIGWGDGETWLVPYTIPGETVEITAARRHRRSRRATAFTILEPSPHRRVAPCPLFGRCGGCSLLHIEPAMYDAVKREMIADLFRQAGRPVVTPPPIRSIGSFNLRSRVRVHIDGGRPSFYARYSHDTVPFDRCPLLHPGLNEILADDAPLRADGSIQYEFSTATGRFSPRDEWVEKKVLGETFRVSRGSFFQASEEGAAALVELFEEALTLSGATRMVDLYCGGGLFSRFARRRGLAVTGMEFSATAQDDYRHNLDGAARFLRTDLSRVTALPDADLIVTDPPRTGMSAATVAAISRSTARHLFYVSCDGATFVRDLMLLEKEGWSLLRGPVIVDQFFATPHGEITALLGRRET